MPLPPMVSTNIPIHAMAAGAAPSPRTMASRLPPLPHAGERGDGLTPLQRRLMVGAIVGVHVAAVYGLLQVHEVREAARDVAPLFADLIAPPAPAAPPAPPPPVPQPLQKRPPPPAPVIAAAPSPAPAAFVVPAPPPPETVAAPAPPAPAVVAPPTPAPPAPAPPPRVIPASAVQYLVEPAPEYPRLSKRNGEAGRVLVLLFIDEAGLPQKVQVAQSSGFARLDASAIAAVQSARFKPPTLNGQPVGAWTNVPIDFGLEK